MTDAALARMTRGGKVGSAPLGYLELYRAEPSDRIRIVKEGIGAWVAKRLVADLHVEQGLLFPALNLSVATVNRKAMRNEPLASDEGERVVGVAKLVGQLQAIIEESGDPGGFDVHAWLSRWLREPLPALGGARPLDMLDTMEGQALVSDALARIQSGAYA
jgi:putative toxin-antitoxin system antitoxin component (TIGR02293 family)